MALKILCMHLKLKVVQCLDMDMTYFYCIFVVLVEEPSKLIQDGYLNVTSGYNPTNSGFSNGEIQLENRNRLRDDLKYISNGGVVNEGHSDEYLHASSNSDRNRSAGQHSDQRSMQQSPRQPPDYASNPNMQTNVNQQREMSPVRSSPTSPGYGSQSSNERPHVHPDERPPLPSRENTYPVNNGLPNLKQYQLQNGFPRMGTNQQTSNGSPSDDHSPINTSTTQLIPDSSGSGYHGNMVNYSPHGHASSPRENNEEFNFGMQESSPSPEFDEFDMMNRERKSQFASLKKKQKRMHNLEDLDNTPAVEKISRV